MIKWSFKAWVSNTEEMDLPRSSIISIGNVCVFISFILCKKTVTKPCPKSANLVSINSS